MEKSLNEILNITRLEDITAQELDVATIKWNSIKSNATQSISQYITCALDDAKDRLTLV